jgi:prepilin-type N-terminal cleavage/methylation domain-containing protein
MTRKCLEFHQASQISRNRGRGGFSAAELLVVVAMLAILATVSLPIFAETLRNSRLSGAARQLVGDIRHARSLAISKGDFYGLHLYPDDALGVDPAHKNSYRIEYSSDGATWPLEDATMGSDPAVITNWQNLSTQFTGVKVDSVVDGGGNPIGGPIFNSIGGSVSPPSPRLVNITLIDDKVIQVSPAGNVKMP